MTAIATVPTHGVLATALALFLIGGAGVMIRRDVIFVLMSLEVMFNGAAVAFIAAAARWHQADGQIAVLFILVCAAAEVGVGLSLVLRLYRGLRTVDGDAVRALRG